MALLSWHPTHLKSSKKALLRNFSQSDERWRLNNNQMYHKQLFRRLAITIASILHDSDDLVGYDEVGYDAEEVINIYI